MHEDLSFETVTVPDAEALALTVQGLRPNHLSFGGWDFVFWGPEGPENTSRSPRALGRGIDTESQRFSAASAIA